VVPLIREAAGTVSKSFGKYLNKIPGKHDIKELQKTAYYTLRTYFRMY
jgi:hypothetical protein